LLLYKSYNLTAANEAVATWLKPTLQYNPSESIKQAYEFFDSPDSFIKQAIVIGQKDEAAMKQRIIDYLTKAKRAFDESTLSQITSFEGYINSMGTNYSVPSATAEMVKYIDQVAE
jgi:hypothetical protein